MARSSLTECLGGLGLELLRGLDERHQGEVDVDDVVLAHVLLELAHRLEEGQPLDVADGAPDLDDHHVHPGGHLPDRRLDLVGDVRDDLDGAAEIVPAALLLDHGSVDLPGGDLLSRVMRAEVKRS